jgi:hypothetical protein
VPRKRLYENGKETQKTFFEGWRYRELLHVGKQYSAYEPMVKHFLHCPRFTRVAGRGCAAPCQKNKQIADGSASHVLYNFAQ